MTNIELLTEKTEKHVRIIWINQKWWEINAADIFMSTK